MFSDAPERERVPGWVQKRLHDRNRDAVVSLLAMLFLIGAMVLTGYLAGLLKPFTP